MSRAKKNNKGLFWIIILLVLVVTFANTAPEESVRVTARYYDADGNLIGTSGRGLDLQSLFSPGTYQVSEIATGLILDLEVTNTGNVVATFSVPSIELISDGTTYATTVSEVSLLPGESYTFTTDIVDISGTYLNSEVKFEINAEYAGENAGDFYRWQFTKPTPLIDCYQEDPLIEDQTGIDGNCGQVYVGARENQAGKYNSGYTIPEGAEGAKLRLKVAWYPEMLIDIPEGCLTGWDAGYLGIEVSSWKNGDTHDIIAYCMRSTINGGKILLYEFPGVHNRYPTSYTGGNYVGRVSDGDWDTSACYYGNIESWAVWGLTYDENKRTACDFYEEAIIWEVPQSGTNCYQESATVPDQTGIDGDCGLDYTGEYYVYKINQGSWVNDLSIYDGNWDSYGFPSVDNQYMLITYKKPVGALSTSTWRKKDGHQNVIDHDIPSTCWNAYSDKLEFRFSRSGGNYYDCYNGEDWESVTTAGTIALYEEAMNWVILNG